MQKRSESVRLSGKKIAFVPTMGFLHQGHMSLLKEGRRSGDDLVLSIFVNPAQFGANEDLSTYPKNIEGDLAMAEKEGVNAVFLPKSMDIYGENYQTYVNLEKLPNYLCGLSRPGHFRGVATVVTKLFNIVKPHVAIFGEKDFQQLAVIRQMAKDLNFDIEIIGAPTVRESDGLAMSSRNSYLSPEQRKSAVCLIKSLQKAGELVKNGEKKSEAIIGYSTEIILSHPETSIDYLTICDPVSLEAVNDINGPVLFAMAVKVGTTRLIDNMILTP
jgi:pantoate--beta-alanine ligase